MNTSASIFLFSPEYTKDFAALNYEWLEHYFVIEEHDREMLEAPKEYIIDKGGQIFLASYNNEIVGTAALIKISNRYFELAKMAVTPKYQRLKIGKKLMVEVIHYSKNNNIEKLMLESNRKLLPALALYKKFGFVEIPTDPESPYERADIKMELTF